MLNRSASLAMSTSVLKALPGKLDIKRHSRSIPYIWDLSGGNRSLGLLTEQDSNQSAQLQKLASKWKFDMNNLKYYTFQ